MVFSRVFLAPMFLMVFLDPMFSMEFSVVPVQVPCMVTWPVSSVLLLASLPVSSLLKSTVPV